MVDLGNMLGSSTLKYLLIGGVAIVVPTLLSKFLGLSGMFLGLGLIVGGVFLMGKLPIVPQAMIVGGGITLLGPMISGLVSGVTSGSSSITAGVEA